VGPRRATWRIIPNGDDGRGSRRFYRRRLLQSEATSPNFGESSLARVANHRRHRRVSRLSVRGVVRSSATVVKLRVAAHDVVPRSTAGHRVSRRRCGLADRAGRTRRLCSRVTSAGEDTTNCRVRLWLATDATSVRIGPRPRSLQQVTRQNALCRTDAGTGNCDLPADPSPAAPCRALAWEPQSEHVPCTLAYGSPIGRAGGAHARSVKRA